MTLNDKLTANHTNPSHPTWIGAGFDPKLVLPEEKAYFQKTAGDIIKDLNQYCEGVGGAGSLVC